MIILGIDPGTAILGYGLIRVVRKEPELIYYGCIETPKNLDEAGRLKIIYKELIKLIKRRKPDLLVIEELFFFKNLKTVMKVSQAKGVTMLAAANLNIPLLQITPLQVKQAVTGYGLAKKPQVQKMVKAILKLKEIPKPDDAADALAVAICGASWQNFHKPHARG